jgi:CheY-like chemotaxis protein
VFVNLMMNAVHAMPTGGTLSLRTYIKDGHWWGEVQDTGVGMTEQVKRRVFEPFFTTKGSAGSGLGMSIVASIVQRHNGIIEIDTAPGRGTTIAVGFPLMLATETRRDSSTPRRVQMRDALQVLVVEDDPRSRDALTLALEQLGHSVTATGELEDALRTFLDGDFTVVFTDLSLGEKSGWEVAQAVKKMRSTAEVILVTGWAAQLGVDDPSTRGVDQVLAKPFTLEQIAAVLERARERRAAAHHPATA